MGKSYKRNRFDDEVAADTVYVNLDEVYLSESTWQKLIDRDFGQIDAMRQEYEDGREMVRVVLRPRAGGGYNVEDGRHRVIAAKLAGISFIEAKVVG